MTLIFGPITQETASLFGPSIPIPWPYPIMMLQLQNYSPPQSPIARATVKSNLSLPTATATADSGLNFRQKLLYLKSLKVDPNKALCINPNLRTASLSSIRSVSQCLSSMGFELSAIGRILDMHPKLLTADPYDDIYPIFEFLLYTVQLPFPDIPKSINRCPRILVADLGTKLKPAFEFLTELGFVGPNKLTSQTTLLLVSSVESTLMPKIEYLVGLGIEYDDVRNMVLRSPRLLTYSVEKNYRPKTEYFLKEMNGDLEEIKRFPQYFSFSLERKIKPRHQLLMEHGILMSISDMLKVSDGEFTVQLIERRLQRLEKGLL